MTAEEWAAVLEARARVEALELHHAGRVNRDPQGQKLAQEAAGAFRRIIAAAAPLTAVLGQPEREEWADIPRSAVILGIGYHRAFRRAERGIPKGTGRRTSDGRLQLHLPSQREFQG